MIKFIKKWRWLLFTCLLSIFVIVISRIAFPQWNESWVSLLSLIGVVLVATGSAVSKWRTAIKPTPEPEDPAPQLLQQPIINNNIIVPDNREREPSDTTKSTLPTQPHFFGRTPELAKIAKAIDPDVRVWGVLIDGPGGMGKTALAIQAAHIAPTTHFKRKLFLSAKKRELTPHGERDLDDFQLPNYMALLTELGTMLGEAGMGQIAAEERVKAVHRALAGQQALIVIDNLETFDKTERDRVVQFLERLPEGNKAIVTSRRRIDGGVQLIRLDRMAQADALRLIDTFAENNRFVARATDAERQQLYEETGGNPLLLRWACGQLGRGQCRTVATACDYLRNAPGQKEGNAPLEYVFGDLIDEFTESQTKVLAALSHFTHPARVAWVMEMTGLSRVATETALDDLTDRAIVEEIEGGDRDRDGIRYFLPPLAGLFLRRKKPDMVQATGDQLRDQMYALIVENGYYEHDRFPVLDGAWEQIAAALPLFLAGGNRQLQTICAALVDFLDFSGRWDVWLQLSEEAEASAMRANDWGKAGWRAYQAGYVHRLQGDGARVLACAERSASHWEQAKAGARERAVALQLRGGGHKLQKDYGSAIVDYTEAIRLWRTIQRESVDVAIGLNDLAGAEQLDGQLDAAERHYREALDIARKVEYQEGVASFTGNLADLMLDREAWGEAEQLAREALGLAEKVGRKELIAEDCHSVAKALLKQGQATAGLPYAQRSVELVTQLPSSPHLAWAQETLAEIEAALR